MRYAKTLLGLACVVPMLEFVLGLFKGNKLSSMTLLCCEASWSKYIVTFIRGFALYTSHISLGLLNIIFDLMDETCHPYSICFFCFGRKLYMFHATNPTTSVIVEFVKAQCFLAITSLIIKLQKHFTTYRGF
jgi:hypothetical protein